MYQALCALGIFGEPLAEGFLMIGWGSEPDFISRGARAGDCHTCSYVGADAKLIGKSREDAAKYYQT
ncbi:hypothetical protein KQR56_11530 [Bacillus velezensis]|nr:hypothetical protein [Bacillus velezensis]